MTLLEFSKSWINNFGSMVYDKGGEDYADMKMMGAATLVPVLFRMAVDKNYRAETIAEIKLAKQRI